MKSTIFLTLLMLSTIGCSQCFYPPSDGAAAKSVFYELPPDPDPDPTPTPVVDEGPYINTGQIGQTWVFQNAIGDATVITVEAPRSGSLIPDNHTVVWHYTKSNDRAYWFPGEHAELWFVLQLKANGWYAPVSQFTCDDCLLNAGATEATVTATPNPRYGYLILPNTQGNYTGGYTPCYQLGVITWSAPTVTTCQPWAGMVISWSINSYMEDVTTPYYTGPALVSEQWEGCDTSGCAHEKWYFAPNLGLVKIIQYTNGAATDPQVGILNRIY